LEGFGTDEDNSDYGENLNNLSSMERLCILLGGEVSLQNLRLLFFPPYQGFKLD
jgi:hypothetical protein